MIWHSFCRANAWKIAPIACGSGRKWPSAVVWARIRRDTCSPILNGIGFDKVQALHPLLVVHQATWRGFYSWNGQTSSSLTGRTSGLPVELPDYSRGGINPSSVRVSDDTSEACSR